MDDYEEDIRERIKGGDNNPINSVLLTTLHEGYDKNTVNNYCEVIELGISVEHVRQGRILFSCKKYEELDGKSITAIQNNNNITNIIDGAQCNIIGRLLETRIIDVSKKIPSYGDTYIYACVGLWTQGPRAYFNIIRKDPVNTEKWIVISSGINLKHFASTNENNLPLVLREYSLLLDSITQTMNMNMHLNVIESTTKFAVIKAESSIAQLEAKNAIYNFARQVVENAPMDEYANLNMKNAIFEAQNASRVSQMDVANAKAAQYTLNESESQIASNTTTWEYGSPNNYNTLKCIYSGIYPSWNGRYIRECSLRDSNVDIASSILNVMTDIDAYYKDLYHGQIILSTYKINDLYYISVVKVIKRDDYIHIQIKDAQLNNIFPSTLNRTNMETPINPQYIFIDPTSRYVGIGSSEKEVKYDSPYITIAPDHGQNVVIQSSTYPNIVATRIAENSGIIRGESHKQQFYFDQFSSATMRRHSNLYTFDQMYENAQTESEKCGNFTTNRKYGGDVSFEITDKNNITKEIGNIGMVIDTIDDTGRVFGGLSVKTVPDLTIIKEGVEILKPGKTIMYVSSEGLLHVKGIMLGRNELKVNINKKGEEQLFWGNRRIAFA